MKRDWRLSGACRGQRPQKFIPDDTGDRDITIDAHAVALKFCAVCEVVSECLEDALANREEFGVWGNTTPRQRRAIREERQRA